MRVRQIKLALALVMALSAGMALFVQFYHPTPHIEPGPHRGIGEALAGRVLQLAPSGARIALIAPDTSAGKFPGAAVQLPAFHEALARAGRSVTFTNVVKLDPNRIVRAPPGDFADILRKLNDADVVVSLLGPPLLSPEQKARVGEKRPRVIAVCTGDMPRQVPWKALFSEGLLHAAIVSHRNPAARLPTADDPAEWFNHSFAWATAVDAAEALEAGRK